MDGVFFEIHNVLELRGVACHGSNNRTTCYESKNISTIGVAIT